MKYQKHTEPVHLTFFLIERKTSSRKWYMKIDDHSVQMNFFVQTLILPKFKLTNSDCATDYYVRTYDHQQHKTHSWQLNLAVVPLTIWWSGYRHIYVWYRLLLGNFLKGHLVGGQHYIADTRD